MSRVPCRERPAHRTASGPRREGIPFPLAKDKPGCPEIELKPGERRELNLRYVALRVSEGLCIRCESPVEPAVLKWEE